MEKITPLTLMGPAHASDRFAVPDACLHDGNIAGLKAAGFPSRRAMVRDGLFETKAHVFRVKGGQDPWPAITAVLAACGAEVRDAHFMRVRDRERPMPLLLPRQGRCRIVEEKAEREKDPQKKLDESIALACYEERLMLISAMLGGTEIVFRYGQASGTASPRPDRPDSIDVYTSCGPNGEFGFAYMRTAFGIPFKKGWEDLVLRGPAKGRGEVIKDDDGQAVAQVIGRSVFLFLPILSAFSTGRGVDLLDRSLAAALPKIGALDGIAEECRRLAEDLADVSAKAEAWIDGLAEGVEWNLSRIDREIAEAQNRIQRLYQERMQFRTFASAFQTSPQIAAMRERVGAEVLAVRKFPEVRTVRVIDGGIHVHTRDLIAEHDGRRYLLGSYVIRIGAANHAAIWSERPLHPDGACHPHISKVGVECFGNATKAVAQFAAEFRYADLVRLLLRWLTKGYTPKLADAAIEEWPRADVEGEDALAAAKEDAKALIAGGRTGPALTKMLSALGKNDMTAEDILAIIDGSGATSEPSTVREEEV